jgi:CelD/BcsL family acetyltransferase involved in cellulose biosynthesis
MLNTLTHDEWARSLEVLPAYPFFCAPGYLNAWVRHHAPRARTRAFSFREDNDAWRILALVETRSSRFGTVALAAAPEGGYGTAGPGSMRIGWVERAVRELRRYHTDRIELVLGPNEYAASPADGSFKVHDRAAWIIDLCGGAQSWLARQVDKRVRRQLHICEEEGVATTRHGIDGLDDFYDLYQRAVRQSANRARYRKEFLADLVTAPSPGRAIIYLTRHRDRTIAAGVLLRGGRDALAWIGCFDKSAAHLHGNLHRHYTVIRDLEAEGVVAYNLGAAPNLPEVARFKQKLGATPQPYTVVTWHNPILSRMRRLMRRAP